MEFDFDAYDKIARKEQIDRLDRLTTGLSLVSNVVVITEATIGVAVADLSKDAAAAVKRYRNPES